jgi:multiple sugar transport system permease protein
MVKPATFAASIVRYAALVALMVVMTGPLLWMIRVAVMPTGSSLQLSALASGSITLSNFVDLFRGSNIGRYLFNSLFVAAAVTAGNVLFCLMAGYVFARYQNPGSRLLFGSVLVVLMLPVHIVIIPLYKLCLELKIYDSYWALILPFLINPIGIFLVKQYVESIPPSMEEAARIDGASEMRILLTIVMPLCRPALAVLGVLAFITNWNSFLFPFILTSSDGLRTLPVALALMQGHQAIDWQHLMAGSTLAVIPVLILFIILQRQVVSGITAGGIKQ